VWGLVAIGVVGLVISTAVLLHDLSAERRRWDLIVRIAILYVASFVWLATGLAQLLS
jgi:hypothetical protein